MSARVRSFFILVQIPALAFPLFWGGVLSAEAQEPGKIVEQYVKAAGGAKVLGRVQTMTIEGTFTAADGKAGTYTFDLRLPNRLYIELFVGGQGVIEAYNGKSAWRQTASGELGTLTGAEGMQLEAASQLYNSHLVDLKKRKIAAGFVGHAQVRGRDTLQLEITSPVGIKRQMYFDPQNHLLVKEIATVGGVDEEILYDDYRAESGVQIPHRLELHRGGDSYDITVTRVAVNGAVGERVFDFPKKSQVQLPDLRVLFKEIDDNQKAIDKIKENYAGTRAEEETEYGKNGISKKESKEFTFFYLKGEEISTLVKRDGKPLSDSEQKKEDEKTRKRIEELQKKQAKREAKAEKGGKEDDPGIEVFLRVCQFVNPRRERFRGQDVLVFDFEPNPEYKARKMEEKIVQKLAGVVWIDEKAHDVVRLEAYFLGDARIGGGLLANIQKGTSFAFEQAFINNEVWLPTYQEAHISARVLLVKGFKINEVTRYSDYKRFNIDTLATIGKPKDISPPDLKP